LSLPINLTDNNFKTNRFYRLIKAWLARRKRRWRLLYDQSRDRHRQQCRIQSSGFEAKQDTARRHLMIASGLPDKIVTAVQVRTLLIIFAPGRTPNPPGTAFFRTFIDYVD
jgi:hypothetical protein